jgi:4-hydroxy-2-oxoheptanedioate aldolase
MANLNPLKAAWAEGRTAFGLWSAIPSSFSAELAAAAGFDYLCVDQQHGVIGYESMVPMLQAIGAEGTAPITRVLSSDPFLIMKALDAGAWGVIVPLVNSAEDAARAVAACRYPPRGMRSYGPVRAAGVIGSRDPEDLAGEVLCIVMVETREGLERVAAGIHSASGEWARKHAEAGFDMVTVATDATLLRAAALRELTIARGGRGEAKYK